MEQEACRVPVTQDVAPHQDRPYVGHYILRCKYLSVEWRYITYDLDLDDTSIIEYDNLILGMAEPKRFVSSERRIHLDAVRHECFQERSYDSLG
jgi:hypothetical protein